MLIIKVILLLLIVVVFFWILSFLLLNDLFLPSKSLKKQKKILVIFPHPDDEILTTGGVLATNGQATLMLLTKGEKGTRDAHLDQSLKEIRSKEAQESSKILHVKKLIQRDYGDGELQSKSKDLEKDIKNTIESEKPDLVITYDLSGLYGHPDHIVISQIVTDIIKAHFKNTKLWYSTYPKRVYDLAKFPEHMAIDKEFKKYRTYPSHKIFVGSNVLNKILAAKANKSQYQSFQSGIPLPIPTAFFHSITIYEYFYEVN